MKKLSDFYNLVTPPKAGDLIEGTILKREKMALFVNLEPVGIGIVRGQEYLTIKEKLKDLKEGEKVKFKVIEPETEEGYIELSLKDARQEFFWEELEKKKKEGVTFKVKIMAANKGGLLTKIEGVDAFLPVSQLSSEHYPRVENADPEKILKELQKFVSKELTVQIFSLHPEKNQIILSEKLKEINTKKELLKEFKEGEIVEGEITAICDFGVFIKFPAKSKNIFIEGLIHISELDWQLIEEPNQIVKVGQKTPAKIIQIQDGKVFLSLKAIKENPWQNIGQKVKKGDIIKATVKKLNPFGAFVEIAPKIQGLCHISEFGSFKEMEKKIKPGESYKFKVLLVDPAAYKILLGWQE